MSGKNIFHIILLLSPLFLFDSGNARPQVYNNNLIYEATSPKPGFKVRIDNAKPLHVPQNKHLTIGNCEAIHNNRDTESVIVYTDHTIIENEGPSTLNGTIEVIQRFLV